MRHLLICPWNKDDEYARLLETVGTVDGLTEMQSCEGLSSQRGTDG